MGTSPSAADGAETLNSRRYARFVELRRLAVAQGFRRRSLGKALVQTAVGFCREGSPGAGGHVVLQLTCLSGGDVPAAAAAQALYEAEGFRRVGPPRLVKSANGADVRMLNFALPI